MRLTLGRPSATAAALLAAAAVSRRHPPCAAIFPGVPLPPDQAEGASDFNGRNPPAVIGFWSIYDDQATQEALEKAAQGERTQSLFSVRMVLRADGQTSRSSNFTLGRWHVESEGKQRKLYMTLKARAQREEMRYEALLFRVDSQEVPGESLLESLTGPAPATAPALGKELRAIGECSRWDVSGDGEPRLIKKGSFSMVKVEVDRSKLTPAIKPPTREVDPEEIRRQQAEQREFDVADAAELRSLLADVRERKQADPEGWQAAFADPTPENAPEEDEDTGEEDAPAPEEFGL